MAGKRAYLGLALGTVAVLSVPGCGGRPVRRGPRTSATSPSGRKMTSVAPRAEDAKPATNDRADAKPLDEERRPAAPAGLRQGYVRPGPPKPQPRGAAGGVEEGRPEAQKAPGEEAATAVEGKIRTIEPVDEEIVPAETVDLTIPLLDETLVGKDRPRLKEGAVDFPLGGDRDIRAVLDLNIPLLKRLLLRPDDLREATVRFKFKGRKGSLEGATLEVYRMLEPVGEGGADALEAGVDHEAEALRSYRLNEVVNEGWLSLAGLGPALQKWAGEEWKDCGVFLVLLRPGGQPPEIRLVRRSSPGHYYWHRQRPYIAVTVASWEKPFIYDWEPKPQEGVYNRLVDGDFDYGGERLRLWGVCRGASHNPLQVHRLKHMGFNAVRLWAGSEYTDESAKRGELDAARMDGYDRYVAEMKSQGIWIMCPTLMANPCGLHKAQKGLLADDSWLAGGQDWEEWKEAIRTKGAPAKFFHYFDERLKRIRERHAENFLNHVNPYTGERYAEEEIIALYEIFNENGFLKWVLERGFGTWPPYFKSRLCGNWNEWLRAKYRTDAGLLEAWGSLDERDVIPNASLFPQRSDRKGTGLKGEYFGDKGLKKLKLTRTDPCVDFDWGKGSPDAKIGKDGFSVRWTGWVAPLASGRHTFHTRTDDGVKLWVGGKKLVDRWLDQAPTDCEGSIDLVAGRKYPIKMEYYESSGGACAQLSWSVEGKPVESLSAGNVKLAPLHGQRKSYPEQRARDFVRFMIETVDEYNQTFRAYCRKLAPEGVGVNVVPFSFDTQYRDNTPWLYADSRGDVVCFGMYYHQMRSSLEGPPSMWGMDSNTVKDKAVVLYEVNTGHPNPYRCEFPLRLTALASWQDWDGVFFHYWQEPYWYWKLLNPEEQYLLEALPYGFNTADVMIECDPAYCTSAALAGQLFRNQSVPDAPNPKVHRVGADAIFGYGRFGGVWMKDATYEYGSRVEFRPDLDEGVTVDGAPPPEARRITEAVKTGPHVMWDWPKGRLIVDAPTAKAYVGKPHGRYKFSDGLVLDGFTTEFAVWAMVADDGKPIVPRGGQEGSERIKVAAVWNNLNTGYEIDPKMIGRKGFVHPGERMKAVRKKGRPPVVADVVPYRIQFPTKLDYVFRGYDFALRKCLMIIGTNVNSLSHDGRELYMGVLEITRRGEKAKILLGDGKPGGARVVRAGREAACGKRRPSAPGVWNPIPGLGWDAMYAEAHRLLRGADFTMAGMSPAMEAAAPEASITLREARIVWSLPADIEIAFENAQMSRITVSYQQAPSITEVVADYTARFGRPAKKIMAEHAFETSEVEWRAVRGRVSLEVALKEHQGSMRIVYRLRAR